MTDYSVILIRITSGVVISICQGTNDYVLILQLKYEHKSKYDMLMDATRLRTSTKYNLTDYRYIYTACYDFPPKTVVSFVS